VTEVETLLITTGSMVSPEGFSFAYAKSKNIKKKKKFIRRLKRIIITIQI
jgi:hypothetical protein